MSQPDKLVDALHFAGRIDIDAVTNVYKTPWAEMIKAAKTSLACWNVDTQAIWERFVAFNKARGKAAVPAGFLLGFMRRRHTSPSAAARPVPAAAPQRALDPAEQQLLRQIKAEPSKNRQFHASDPCRVIVQSPYDAHVLDVIRQFGCPRFTATLAVHGRSVLAGEISR